MSFQFEDDSALEELLNQQLDRRKQQPSNQVSALSKNRPSTTKSVPKVSVQHQESVQSSSFGGSRPATAILSKQDHVIDGSLVSQQQQQQATSSLVTLPSRSRLADWLDGKSSSPNDRGLNEQKPAISGDFSSGPSSGPVSRPTAVTVAPNEALADDNDLDKLLREDQLQEMSKQRLIKLILSQIVPKLQSLEQLNSEHSASRVEKIIEELESEREKKRLLELDHAKEIKSIESKWTQLNKQLESRLASSQQELDDSIIRHKDLLRQVEDDYKQQIDKLREGYQSKLEDAKAEAEQTLRRRDELHQLELESKLKVNCDLIKLDTIFSEWHKMLQSTIRDLDVQFKSVESLLDKQTIEINGTNLELVKKTKLLTGHYDKFELRMEQMGSVAEKMGDLLPAFTSFQLEHDSLVKKMNSQLDVFLTRSDELGNKERELDLLKQDLQRSGLKLTEERFELALSTSKLTYREERLAERIAAAEEQEDRWRVERQRQLELESRLESMRLNLDNKSEELRRQNYDLHLTRKRLTEKAEELDGLELKVEGERKWIDKQLQRVDGEGRKLAEVRDKARRELSQLRRLQKSLICTLCLDRLFKGSSEIAAMDLGSGNNNRFNGKFSTLKDIGGHNGTSDPLLVGGEQVNSNNNNNQSSDFQLELAKLNRYIELDAKKLEAENKYVELLSGS